MLISCQNDFNSIRQFTDVLTIYSYYDLAHLSRFITLHSLVSHPSPSSSTAPTLALPLHSSLPLLIVSWRATPCAPPLMATTAISLPQNPNPNPNPNLPSISNSFLYSLNDHSPTVGKAAHYGIEGAVRDAGVEGVVEWRKWRREGLSRGGGGGGGHSGARRGGEDAMGEPGKEVEVVEHDEGNGTAAEVVEIEEEKEKKTVGRRWVR